jgi:hypothetical protein
MHGALWFHEPGCVDLMAFPLGPDVFLYDFGQFHIIFITAKESFDIDLIEGE